MRPLTPRPYLALFVLLALAAGPARGDMIDFSYSWSFGETFLSAFGAGPIQLSSSISPDGSAFTVDHGSGTATLKLAAPGDSSATPGGVAASIPAGTLSALSGNPGGDFAFSAGFDLKLRISAAGETGELSMAAAIGGLTSPKGSEVGAAGYTFAGGEAVLLGGHYYTAGFYTDPDEPLVFGTEPVTLKVGILIDPADLFSGVPINLDGNPTTQSTPEPSALVLGACAVALCGLGRLRLSRAARSAR